MAAVYRAAGAAELRRSGKAGAIEQRLRKRAGREQRWAGVTLWAGVAILGLAVIVAVVGPVLLPGPNRLAPLNAFASPSWTHPFGTDDLGRDVFRRCVWALRLDLIVVVVITFGPMVLGFAAGTIAAYYGGWAEGLLGRLTDVVMAFPFLVLVLAAVAIMGPGLKGVVLGVYIVGWALYARLSRADMLVLKRQNYILAAQGLGLSNGRIIARHAVPNLVKAPLVFAMTDAVLNLLLVAGVSYLGFGVQPPQLELGQIAAEGQQFLLNAWWITTFPGLMIVALGLGFSLLGDGLADRLGLEFLSDL